jgi:hypothetical protein
MVAGKQGTARAEDMAQAIADLDTSHMMTKTVLPGNLEYVILMATAGPCLKVFARKLDSCQPLVPLLSLQVRLEQPTNRLQVQSVAYIWVHCHPQRCCCHAHWA